MVVMLSVVLLALKLATPSLINLDCRFYGREGGTQAIFGWEGSIYHPGAPSPLILFPPCRETLDDPTTTVARIQGRSNEKQEI
jgi:hypothetical protein